MLRRIPLIALAWTAWLALAHGAAQPPTPNPTQQAASASAASPVDFVRDVQPILEQHCYECHGPSKARGSLRLHTRAGALKGGISGPIIQPGNSDASLIVRRLLGLDGDDRMPLDKDPLLAGQLTLIRRWIDQGAVWPADAGALAAAADDQNTSTHWAYVAPRRPPLPQVRTTGWVRTPIDQFVLARLETEGLHPAPEASKEALLRRASLDLIGVPPTLAELDDFLADIRPDAYERAVDRLLASPHYGERWARPWLDLARYADSNGYEKDRLRTMWKYRDWVIDALNRDMPFDQFTIEQIAGDMLPNATQAQLVATGFHRNTLLNQEGGIDVEEARWETLVDRVSTTGTVWLGTTIGCAQCHNHKYDPFSQRDFYRMLAFFDNGEYSVGGKPDGDRWIEEPELPLPTPEQEVARKSLQVELDALKPKLAEVSPEITSGQAAWEDEMRAAERAWTVLQPMSAHAAHGTVLAVQSDGSVLASGPAPPEEQYIVRAQTPIGGITGIRLEALPDPSLPQGGPGRDYYGNFVLSGFTVETASAGSRAAPRRITFSSAKTDDGNDAEELLMPPADTGRTRDLPPGWSIDATRDETRLPRRAVFTAEGPFGDAATTVTITLSFAGRAASPAIGRFRLAVTTAPDPTTGVTLKPSIRPILSVPASERTSGQQTVLGGAYRSVAPALEPIRARVAAIEEEIKALGIVTAPVMHERHSYERPTTWFRERGSFMAKGARVVAGTPAILPPLPDEVMPNRLGLAYWLVSDENPLTARVTVNRAWEQFFGRGIVETSEDFGTQGAAPTHPALLDWLATELVKQRWSMKTLHRLIVTSATYRQSAAASQDLIERDPYNRLFARGPRFRMEAEMIRDSALSASGLLSAKVGGPSVFPVQPEGIWDNPYSDAKWVPSSGEDQHRRGLYTFLRRTSPYPSLITFDGTSREACTVRRIRTNTPLQALVTLNDDAYIEAARALGTRMLTEVPGRVENSRAHATQAHAVRHPGGGFAGAADPATDRERAAYGFRLCTSRAPTAIEVDWIVGSYKKQLAHFRKARDRAAALVKIPADTPDLPERAAWAMVANALLNLDETLTK
jgi:hypothetical protein